MRAGFTVSTVAHAALIALAIVGIGMGRPLDPTPVESIAVDLVPISEFTNIRMGSLDSEVVETEAPSAVEAETPPEIAQPTGNTEEDQPTPADNRTETPAPTENTAPQPEAAPEPAPEPEPEVAPVPAERPAVEPQPEPAPEPVPEPEPAPVATPEVTPDPADAAPKPFVRTASLEQKRAEFKKQQQAEKQKKADEKAKADAAKKKADEEKKKKAAADEKKRIEQAKAAEQKKIADEVADIINNEDSRGATTGKGGQPTLGKETGRSATLSQSEMAGLSAAMKACFSPPPGAAEEGATALVEVKLSPDGMVVGQPAVLSITGASTGQMTGSAAVRAVQRCGQNGYSMLPAEKYAGADGWNTVKVTFNANEAL